MEDNSVELITACECLHYLDIGKFNQQVDRLLAPGGLFAVIGYLPVPRVTKVQDDGQSSSPDDAMNQMIDKVFDTWEAAGIPVKGVINLLASKYRGLQLPFERLVYEATFPSTLTNKPASFLVHLISSFSPSEVYQKKFPKESQAQTEGIIKDIQTMLQVEDLNSIQINATFDYFVIVFQK